MVQKIINFDDDIKKQNIKEENLNWPQVPNHLHRIIIIGGSGSTKISSLFNLIKNQSDIDKIYLYAKDPHEAKYQCLIKKSEEQSVLIIQKLLFMIRMIWLIFIKALDIIIHIKNVKY